MAEPRIRFGPPTALLKLAQGRQDGEPLSVEELRGDPGQAFLSLTKMGLPRRSRFNKRELELIAEQTNTERPEENSFLGSLPTRAFSFLGALNFAVAGAAEELFTKRGGGVSSAFKRVFAEVGEGLRQLPGAYSFFPEKVAGAQQEGFAQVMEQSGITQLGQLSSILPGLYDDLDDPSDFHFFLNKGGMLDITGRGALGFLLDVALDPLTYLGGTGAIARTAKAVKESGGKLVFRKGALDAIAREQAEVITKVKQYQTTRATRYGRAALEREARLRSGKAPKKFGVGETTPVRTVSDYDPAALTLALHTGEGISETAVYNTVHRIGRRMGYETIEKPYFRSGRQVGTSVQLKNADDFEHVKNLLDSARNQERAMNIARSNAKVLEDYSSSSLANMLAEARVARRAIAGEPGLAMELRGMTWAGVPIPGTATLSKKIGDLVGGTTTWAKNLEGIGQLVQVSINAGKAVGSVWRKLFDQYPFLRKNPRAREILRDGMDEHAYRMNADKDAIKSIYWGAVKGMLPKKVLNAYQSIVRHIENPIKYPLSTVPKRLQFLAHTTKAFTNRMYRQEYLRGMLTPEQYRANYIPHYYKNSKRQMEQLLRAKGMSQTQIDVFMRGGSLGRAGEFRLYDTYEDAVMDSTRLFQEGKIDFILQPDYDIPSLLVRRLSEHHTAMAADNVYRKLAAEFGMSSDRATRRFFDNLHANIPDLQNMITHGIGLQVGVTARTARAVRDSQARTDGGELALVHHGGTTLSGQTLESALFGPGFYLHTDPALAAQQVARSGATRGVVGAAYLNIRRLWRHGHALPFGDRNAARSTLKTVRDFFKAVGDDAIEKGTNPGLAPIKALRDAIKAADAGAGGTAQGFLAADLEDTMIHYLRDNNIQTQGELLTHLIFMADEDIGDKVTRGLLFTPNGPYVTSKISTYVQKMGYDGMSIPNPSAHVGGNVTSTGEMFAIFKRNQLVDVDEANMLIKNPKLAPNEAKLLVQALGRRNPIVGRKLVKRLENSSDMAKMIYLHAAMSYVKTPEDMVKLYNQSKKLLKSIDPELFAKFRETVENARIQDLIDPFTGEPMVKVTATYVKQAKAGGKAAIERLKGKYVPQSILRTIMDTETFNQPSAVRDLITAWDWVNNWFKIGVTMPWPSFHFRNAYSNIAQSFLDIGIHAANPVMWAHAFKAMRGLEGTLVFKNGRRMTYRSIREYARRHGVIVEGRHIAEVKDIGTGLTKKGRLTQKLSAPAGVIENNSRMIHFIAGMHTYGLTVAEAADRTKKFLFDYGALSKPEREIFTRIMPFYRWTRKNVPLQLASLVKRPGRVATLTKPFQGYLRGPEAELLPDYVAGDLKVRLESEDGKAYFVTGIDLPISDLERIWAGSGEKTARVNYASISPVLKGITDALYSEDVFTGRALDGNMRGIPELIYRYPSGKLNLIGKWLEVHEKVDADGTRRDVGNPAKLYLMFRAWAASRIISTTRRFQNRLTDEELKKDGLALAIAELGTGLTWREFDMTDAERKKLRGQMKELEEKLASKGVLREYKVAYLPKEETGQFDYSEPTLEQRMFLHRRKFGQLFGDDR